jgi:aspartate 1-decarboxylase
LALDGGAARDFLPAMFREVLKSKLHRSITTGARLETYILPGKPGTGHILINGGAAHLIKAGERVAIMAFALSETPVASNNLLLDEKNQIVRQSR